MRHLISVTVLAILFVGCVHSAKTSRMPASSVSIKDSVEAAPVAFELKPTRSATENLALLTKHNASGIAMSCLGGDSVIVHTGKSAEYGKKYDFAANYDVVSVTEGMGVSGVCALDTDSKLSEAIYRCRLKGERDNCSAVFDLAKSVCPAAIARSFTGDPDTLKLGRSEIVNGTAPRCIYSLSSEKCHERMTLTLKLKSDRSNSEIFLKYWAKDSSTEVPWNRVQLCLFKEGIDLTLKEPRFTIEPATFEAPNEAPADREDI